MNPLISADELAKIINRNSIVLVDVSNDKNAYQNYLSAHLSNACFVDLNQDLSNCIDPKTGGRHPLPELEDFKKVLERIGVQKESHVVIYDHQSGANAAARFWWMLKAIGHKKVQVLDGGFQMAIQSGIKTTTLIPKVQNSSNYDNINWELPTVTMNDVLGMVQNNFGHIIDVRDAYRFNGESEPIDLIAGHIPSAKNIPYSNNLQENGCFKSAEELRNLYETISNENTVIYCGSGVTACHTLLAFSVAGLPIPKLYLGSWSEWSRNF